MKINKKEALNIESSKNLISQVKIPNKTTQKAIKEARIRKNVEKITLDKLKSN